MTRNGSRIGRARLGAVAALGLLVAARNAPAKETAPVAARPSAAAPGDWKLDIWNDPTFKKQFVAGYGVNSDIEPKIKPEEIAVLEEIRPMMPGDLPKAEARLRKAVKPDASALIEFTLGSVLFQQDKLDDAQANFKIAVEKFPSFRRAWRNLGLVCARLGKQDEAIEAFTKMIELGGGDAYSYGLLGFAYASKQDFQAAEAAYRNALLLQPGNLDWRLGMTRCVFREQKYEDAVNLLEELISGHPDKADFWLLQAQAFLGMKQPLKAAQDLESMERLGFATVDSLHTLGDVYFNEGLLDLAAGACERAIKLDPSQSPARSMRSAEMLASRGAFDEARRVAAKIRETWEKGMEPNDQRKLLKLEARLSMAEGGDGAEAVKALEEIVRLEPLDGEALMMLGRHYGNNGEPDRAIFYYERAAGIDAFEASAKLRQAQVLVGMGRHKEAIPLIRRSQEVKPREDVARYLEQVERLARTRQ